MKKQANKQTSNSQPCLSKTGNQPHRATMGHFPLPVPTSPHQSNPKFEMKPPPSPFSETRPLTSYPSFELTSPPLLKSLWAKRGGSQTTASRFGPPASQGGLTLGGQDGSRREGQAQPSRASAPAPGEKMEAHLLVGALPEVPCHGILLALIQKHQPAKRPAERP